MKNPLVVFDGVKLCNVHTGMHRYMTECLRALDPLLADAPYRVELVYPAFREINCPPLRNIKIKKLYRLSLRDVGQYGKRAAVVTTTQQWWDVVLPRYVKRHNALLCGMMNDNPVGERNLICLHDVLLVQKEAGYPQKLVEEYQKKYQLLRQHCRCLLTVSETAKREISDELNFPIENIVVTYNGWEHMQRVAADGSIRQTYPALREKQFYYALGTLTPHKNYRWVVEAAKRNPDSVFAVAGKIGESAITEEWKLPNLLYLGRVSDGENKWLMQNCKAFLHPSFLEGFGIPPLEALSCGAPIIISNASCLPEIYGDAAHYFDPRRYDYDLDELLMQPVAPAAPLLEKYSWKKSAEVWLHMIGKILAETETQT